VPFNGVPFNAFGASRLSIECWPKCHPDGKRQVLGPVLSTSVDKLGRINQRPDQILECFGATVGLAKMSFNGRQFAT
jgi:hypothetical protein